MPNFGRLAHEIVEVFVVEEPRLRAANIFSEVFITPSSGRVPSVQGSAVLSKYSMQSGYVLHTAGNKTSS